MQKFRNPYLSSFLAILILFLSCQQPDESIENEKQQLTLKEFTGKHLSISKSIVKLFNNEKNIDVDILLNSLDTINDEVELTQILKDSNINNYNELAILFQQLISNSEMFRKANPEFYHLNEKERVSILTKEIETLSNSDSVQQKSSSTCAEIRADEESECSAEYAIGMAVATVAGLVSFGWGTVIGFAALQVTVVACVASAQSNYEDCIANQ